MMNYFSYVAVAYDHLRSYASAEPSDLTNDDHCGHHLGNHGGVTHGHARPAAVLGYWLVCIWSLVIKNKPVSGMQAEVIGCLVGLSYLCAFNT